MTLSIPKALSWVVAVFGGIVLAIILFGNNTPHPYVVYADVADASDLLPNNFVKIDGLEAGTVESVTLSKGEKYAIVKMGLDSGSFPIGQGASVAIRPVNLLGEKYVQLNPGNLSKPVKNGTTIPMSRSTLPVELDDVFNTLTPDTRSALGVIINEAGLGLAGQASNFQQTLADLPPTLGAARQVVGEVASENAELRNAIVDGNQTLQTVDGSKAALQNLIVSGNNAVRSINTARTNLGRTLETAPAGLAQLRTSLTQLAQAADALTPASNALNATSPSLATTLERLPGFTSDATGALNEAQSVAPLLTKLGDQSTPILRDLRPTAAALAKYTSTSQPLMNTLDQGTGLRYLLGFINNWAEVTSTKDKLGHVFNLDLALSPSFVTHALSVGGLEGDLRATKAPAKSKTTATPVVKKLPAATPTPGSTPTATGTPSLSGTLAGLGNGLKGILGNTGAALGGVVSKTTSGLGGALNKTTAGLGAALSGGSSSNANASGSGSATSGSSSGTPASATARLLHFLLGS